jgi:hypothetical protein
VERETLVGRRTVFCGRASAWRFALGLVRLDQCEEPLCVPCVTFCSGLLGTWASRPSGVRQLWREPSRHHLPPPSQPKLCICSKVGSHGRVYDRLLKPFSFFYRLQFFYLLLQAFVKFHFSAALVRKVHTSL